MGINRAPLELEGGWIALGGRGQGQEGRKDKEKRDNRIFPNSKLGKREGKVKGAQGRPRGECPESLRSFRSLSRR